MFSNGKCSITKVFTNNDLLTLHLSATIRESFKIQDNLLRISS